MEVFNAAFPVLPGKSDQARALTDELNGTRRREFEDLHARFGTTRETWALQSTPGGELLLVWFDAPDLEKGFSTLAQSTDPFDVWFRNQIQDITGFDLAAPPEGPPPEVRIDWKV